ncbi:Gfo/Idh/MocA family oxidoreductase [Candidatus Pelagibacter sp.]|nr:Gfo/Idh/MocA family oxidoreductase [Candidatus Pelagibacter sp.]
MATKYLDAKKMYLIAKKYKKILSVGHNRRYSSVYEFINKLNQNKKIGKILHIDSNFSASGALNYKKKFWRANRNESPGGAIAGLGIHMIDLMCFFGGEVKSVQALVKKYAVKINIDDTTSAIFELKKNCTGNLTTIFACPYTTTFNIFATNMNIFSDVDKNKIKIIHKDGIIQKINLSKKNTLFLELQEFADNCKNKKKYRIKNSEAAHNVKVMEAIVKSSKNNKKIYL